MAVMETVEIGAEGPRAGGLRLSSAPLVAAQCDVQHRLDGRVGGDRPGLQPLHRPAPRQGAYGLFQLVTPLVGYFAMLDVGLGQAVLKYASEYYGRGDMDRLSRLIGTANLCYLVIGSVGAARGPLFDAVPRDTLPQRGRRLARGCLLLRLLGGRGLCREHGAVGVQRPAHGPAADGHWERREIPSWAWRPPWGSWDCCGSDMGCAR